MARKPKDLSEEDKALWEAVKEDIAPLSDRGETPEPPRMPKVTVRRREEEFLHALPKMATLPLANIDDKRRKRLRRGQLEIGTTIDLHGQNRERAYAVLKRLLIRAAERGERTVLVITGKGGRRFSQTGSEIPVKCRTYRDFEPDGGILRNQLPLWLASTELSPLIVSYEQAAQQHGGKGAFYVILRRLRDR